MRLENNTSKGIKFATTSKIISSKVENNLSDKNFSLIEDANLLNQTTIKLKKENLSNESLQEINIGGLKDQLMNWQNTKKNETDIVNFY